MKKLQSEKGMSGLLLSIIILILFIGALIGVDFGYIYYLEECGDTPVKECLLDSENDDENDEKEEGNTVTATGGLSEKGYSANISLTFPLEGGAVSGSVSGDCSGNVEGTYAGGDQGSINGKIFGKCTPFLVPIPAQGTFSGVVNQDNKTVTITGTGSAAGFSGSRTITLTYK
jgi:hypothetical protein